MLDISVLKRKNFEPDEFYESEKAKELGINNSICDPIVLANLNRTADKAQEIRDLLGFPVKGRFYRCLKLNRALKSKDTSQHIKGQAGDITCHQFGTPEQIVKYLKEKGVVVDQCLVEETWVHFSIREFGANRNMFGYYLLNNQGERELILIK